LLGVELINGLELFVEEFSEAAAEAADVLLLLLLLSGVDDESDELLLSTFARTAVGFTGYKINAH
jgi:hypothetical protein